MFSATLLIIPWDNFNEVNICYWILSLKLNGGIEYYTMNLKNDFGYYQQKLIDKIAYFLRLGLGKPPSLVSAPDLIAYFK